MNRYARYGDFATPYAPWTRDAANPFGLPWQVRKPDADTVEIVNHPGEGREQVIARTPLRKGLSETTRRAILTCNEFAASVMNATGTVRAHYGWDYECATQIGRIFAMAEELRNWPKAFAGAPWHDRLKAVLKDDMGYAPSEGIGGAAAAIASYADAPFVYDYKNEGVVKLGGSEQPVIVVFDIYADLFRNRAERHNLTARDHASVSGARVARQAAWRWTVLETMRGFKIARALGQGRPSHFPHLVAALREGLPDIEARSVPMLGGAFSDAGNAVIEAAAGVKKALACFDSPVERNLSLLALPSREREAVYAARHSLCPGDADFFAADAPPPAPARKVSAPHQKSFDFS